MYGKYDMSSSFDAIISGTQCAILGPSTINLSAYLPSLCKCVDKIPFVVSSSLDKIQAPAPSPKITVTPLPRVDLSNPLL